MLNVEVALFKYNSNRSKYGLKKEVTKKLTKLGEYDAAAGVLVKYDLDNAVAGVSPRK